MLEKELEKAYAACIIYLGWEFTENLTDMELQWEYGRILAAEARRKHKKALQAV